MSFSMVGAAKKTTPFPVPALILGLSACNKVARDIDDISLETDNRNVWIKGTVPTEEVKNENASTVSKVAERIGAGSND